MFKDISKGDFVSLANDLLFQQRNWYCGHAVKFDLWAAKWYSLCCDKDTLVVQFLYNGNAFFVYSIFHICEMCMRLVNLSIFINPKNMQKLIWYFSQRCFVIYVRYYLFWNEWHYLAFSILHILCFLFIKWSFAHDSVSCI